MKRRRFLLAAGSLALGGAVPRPSAAQTTGPLGRVRPADSTWPRPDDWTELGRALDGALLQVRSPLSRCAAAPDGAECEAVFRSLANPYAIGDEPGLAQTLGWVGAWTFAPSPYAVAARNARDVAATVNFARERNLRLAVKGGGHSYLGTSCAPDSLLIWTRRMNAITLHDAFAGEGCDGRMPAVPAVTVGAGAIWQHVYDAVTTRGGRYVQGGGCATVGVAGLIQSGGFGVFSKRYGMAAASLLEAEVVTADGAVRVANACVNPDLFWGLKGGGGGSLGVVTRLTLRTHDLPEFFGAVIVKIRAQSDAAFRELIGQAIRFYQADLFNPHWGNEFVFGADNSLGVLMLFQGLEGSRAQQIWQPFLGWVSDRPKDFSLQGAPLITAFPARRMWDPAHLKQLHGVVVSDSRPGAPEGNILWAADAPQAGQFLHAYRSVWLPASLLAEQRQADFAGALFEATRSWDVALHFNKGLAGAPPEAVEAARNTATNPAVLDAFALAIIAGGQGPAYPGIAGHEPDAAAARRHAAGVARAMEALRRVAPEPASYVSESDFFESRWQRAYWGANYPRLLAVKQAYDPGGLFTVHHGVGSEQWSADGFTRLAA